MPDLGVTAEWIRDSIMKITALCERIETKQEELDRRMNKVDEYVNELRDKPSKRWETVITAVLTTIIGILIGAYFSVPKV